MAKFYENIEVQGTVSATTLYGDGSNLSGVNIDLQKYGNLIFVDKVYGNNLTAEINNPEKPFLTYTDATTAATSGTTLIILNPGIYDERFQLKNNVDIYAHPNVILSSSTSNTSFGTIGDSGIPVISSIYGYLKIINDSTTSTASIRVTANSNVYIEMLDIVRSGNCNSENCIYVQSDGNFTIKCRDMYSINNSNSGGGMEFDRRPTATTNNFLVECNNVRVANSCLVLREWAALTINANSFYSVNGRALTIRTFWSTCRLNVGSIRTAGTVCVANDNFGGTGNVFINSREIVSESTTLTSLGSIDNACIIDYGQQGFFIKSNEILSDGALCYLSIFSRPTAKCVIEGNMYSKQNVIARISGTKKTIFKNSVMKRDNSTDDNKMIIFGTPAGVPGIFGGQGDGFQTEFSNVKLLRVQPSTGTSTNSIVTLDGTTSLVYCKNVEIIGTNMASGSTAFNADTLSEGNVYFKETISNIDNGVNVTDTSAISGFIYDTNINTFE